MHTHGDMIMIHGYSNIWLIWLLMDRG